MKAIVLAAGKGKRLHSEEFSLPKVLRPANGRPLLRYVLENLSFLPKSDIIVVAGYKKESVIQELRGEYGCAVQAEQLGTGHAAAATKELLRGYAGPVLVCYGDMPLIRRQTYLGMIKTHLEEKNSCTLLTGTNPGGLRYGRILRGAGGGFAGVVEDKDCTPEQKTIRELNAGVYVFDSKTLFDKLSLLKNDNAQGEYYLTDVPGLILQSGGRVGTYRAADPDEILGVNTPEELEKAERILARGERGKKEGKAE